MRSLCRQASGDVRTAVFVWGCCGPLLGIVHTPCGDDSSASMELVNGTAWQTMHNSNLLFSAGWPMEAYQLVGRADIVANLCSPEADVESKGEAVAAGRGASTSSNRPALPGRTPLAKPQLRTPLPGTLFSEQIWS